METFICAECDRLFKSKMALSGHSRVHSSPAYNPPKIDRRIICEITGKRILPENLEAHVLKLRVCQHTDCDKHFVMTYNSKGLYCSPSCSVSMTNKDRIRTEEWKKKVSEQVKAYWDGLPPQPRKRRIDPSKPVGEKYLKKSNVVLKVCPNCNKSFYKKRSSSQKNCSRLCSNEAQSKMMIDRILNGTSGNFSTKIGDFSYSDVIVSCDSKLEAAGVIFLVDHMGASKIDRCTSIINFKDDLNINHKFNPDFYVTTSDDRRIIVEVKQVWRQSPNINKYNRFFEEKREALINFSSSKGLESLWLDFDYDPAFQKIYRKLLKSKGKLG